MPLVNRLGVTGSETIVVKQREYHTLETRRAREGVQGGDCVEARAPGLCTRPPTKRSHHSRSESECSLTYQKSVGGGSSSRHFGG